MSLFWSAVLRTADMSGGTVFSAFSSGKKKVTANQWDSKKHRMCEAWSRSLSVLWCCLFFLFLKNVGRREAPSATQSDCYLTLGLLSPQTRRKIFLKGQNVWLLMTNHRGDDSRRLQTSGLTSVMTLKHLHSVRKDFKGLQRSIAETYATKSSRSCV